MRTCGLLLALLVVCLVGASGESDGSMRIPESGGCAWDTNAIQSAGLDAFQDSDCLSWSSASSIHFESTGCACHVWYRLQGTNHGCSEDPDECTAHRSSNASLVAPGLSGGSTIPAGNFSIEYDTTVACGEGVSFSVSSSCDCYRHGHIVTLEYLVIDGTLVVVGTYHEASLLTCSSGAANNLQVRGACNQDCDPDNVPAPVVVD